MTTNKRATKYARPSVTKLERLVACIEANSITQVTNVNTFDRSDNYVKNIVVHTNSEAPIHVYLAGEIIESGIAVDGSYEVSAFQEVPFPYNMYPLLSISSEEPYTISYEAIDYDKILRFGIYNFGSYHKINDTQFVHMSQNYIQISNSSRSTIYSYPSLASVEDTVVVECPQFYELAKMSDYDWMGVMLLPGMGPEYLKASPRQVIPCLIYKKANVAAFISLIKARFPAIDIKISSASPKDVLEKNKELVGTVLHQLLK